ncbi:MAG: hypothetical protein JOZ87_20450 [Chloroflexi bacterium]|nr:hypothetical protein [Chloroflexota bacterium]
MGALEGGDRTTPRPATVLLADALGASPADRDRLLAAAHTEQCPTDTGAASLARHGLLAPPTPLLGRERDIAAVSQLVSPSGGAARLVTLIGPCGVGNTRLAYAAAIGLAADFPDGIAFVDLTPLRDARLVPPTSARALDVRESGGWSAPRTAAGIPLGAPCPAGARQLRAPARGGATHCGPGGALPSPGVTGHQHPDVSWLGCPPTARVETGPR